MAATGPAGRAPLAMADAAPNPTTAFGPGAGVAAPATPARLTDARDRTVTATARAVRTEIRPTGTEPWSGVECGQ